MHKKSSRPNQLKMIFLCLLLLSPFLYFESCHCQVIRKSVGISIIVDVGQVDDVLNFLSRLNCSKWSIVLTTGLVQSGILENSTFVNAIKLYGELLPGLWMIQMETLESRKLLCDYLIQQWETHVGYRPYGFFMFHSDTYVANYLYSQGVYYIQGYCFDQYAVDWMSMRGGWQQPYYASEKHVLIPKSKGKGIIILPHLIWDWRDSFEIDHQYNSSPMDSWVISDHDYEKAKNYVLSLMNATLESVKPFSYFVSQSEPFGWGGQFKDESIINHTDFFKSIITNAQKLNANLEMFNETAKWFLDNFENNLIYSFTFVSPYSNKKCEWYFSSEYRVTKYDEYIVGFIEYQKQKEDPYLTQIAHPDFDKSPHDPNACVDNSLTFTIDDFGNGEYRPPPKHNRILYPANPKSFPQLYNLLMRILKAIVFILKLFRLL